MTNLITEARELCEKAAPGPWYAKENWLIGGYSITTKDAYPHDERVPEVATMASKENAEFIARSRTLIPELCDALEKAGAQMPRWIPVSERFPMPVDLNQQGFVLGLFDNGDVDFCGGKEAQHITTLTHWMELPAAPEEGAEK